MPGDDLRILALVVLAAVMFVALTLLPLGGFGWHLLEVVAADLVRIPLLFGGSLGLACAFPLTLVACLDRRAGLREGALVCLTWLAGSMLALGVALAIPWPNPK